MRVGTIEQRTSQSGENSNLEGSGLLLGAQLAVALGLLVAAVGTLVDVVGVTGLNQTGQNRSGSHGVSGSIGRNAARRETGQRVSLDLVQGLRLGVGLSRGVVVDHVHC